MREKIRQRTLHAAEYLLKNRATLRQTAVVFGVGKSTLHTDLTERLPHIDKALAREVYAVLRQNHDCRHIRGGESTRLKYLRERQKKDED